jgi:beta-lactamase class A
MPTTRRPLLIAAMATVAGLAARPAHAATALATLTALEQRHGGRLGVAMLDLGGGPGLAHRADERFAMCSTFKLMLAAATLAQIDAGRWKPDQRLTWTAADAVPHMPLTEPQDGRAGMTLIALARAAQTHSDNLAANLLIKHLGGPAAFVQWLRAQGDEVTRMDRLEPEMNRVLAGDERDTTTPAAMAANLTRLLRGPMLADGSRARLLGWMRATRTGLHRLRAGLPAGWVAGDKTGTGFGPDMPDRLNDLAIAWPPGGRAPRLIAAYYESPRRGGDRIQARDEAVLADVGRLAAR